jgi:phenylalanyl-tRNA synthetase beta chain
MRVPISWLADHLVDLTIPAEELAARLVVAAVEVDRVTHRGLVLDDGNAEHVVAGLVVEAGKHPNADRLQLCRVDVGEGAPRQIVCGAWNFGAGDTVAVALPGLRMPDGRVLEPARLRGETSNGMILSERELELSDAHDGILVLDDGYGPGEPLAARLPLTDEVLELEVGSNRSDLLSVRGIAREVSTLFGVPMRPLDEREPATAGRPTIEWVRVATDEPDLCPRFTARVFDGVTIGPSPLWLKARLSAAGIRPISNVVDVTNHVMHDLGNPLHAYDHARVAGGELRARRARPGETLTTLDGKVRALDPSMLVIADGDGPSGIAGIMGGADSEIGDDTTTVVLEAANFTRAQVMRTSRRLGLRTEGSNRWEKGVDPHLAPIASRAAARLLLEVAGGTQAPDPLDVSTALPERAHLHLRQAQVPRITGVDVPRDDAVRILDGLGFEPQAAGDGIDVRVPTWRWLDVTREIDLVEEVIRIHGLERVPSTLPAGARTGGLTRSQRLRRLLADAACGAGLDEAQTVSLVAEDWAERLGLAPDDPRRRAVVITNPPSAEHARMRPLLLPGLLDAVARNVSLGRDDVGLFEVAHVFHHREDGPLVDEPWTLGALLHGHLGGAGWRGPGVLVSFFAARGVLDVVLGAVGLEAEIVRADRGDGFLHPGRAGRVLVNGADVGWIGELHPALAEPRRLGVTAGFEIDIDALEARLPSQLVAEPVPDQPPLRQDIAVVVADEHPAAAVVGAALEAGGELLQDVELFDVYRDAAVLGPGRRSLALRLTFQAPDRTLSDDEVRPVRERIVEVLAERVGATLRA